MDNRKPPNFSKRGSSLSFREPKHIDNTIQYCNRIGCSTRLNSTKAVQIQTLAKTKLTKTSLCSINTNCVGESSNSQTKAYRPRSNIKSEQEDITLESPTSQSSSNSRPHKQVARRFVSTNHEIPSSSALPRNNSIKPTNQVAKTSVQTLGPRPPRFGLKNLNCSSVPDILPSSRRVASVRKNTSVAENTSSRGKSLCIQSTDSNVSSISQQVTRRLRSNKPIIRDRPGPGLGPTSVRARSNQVGAPRIRSLGRQNDDIIRVDNTQLTVPEVFPENSSVSLPVDSDASISSSSSGGRGFLSRLVSSSRSEDSSSRGAVGDRDGYRRFNVEGIAEVMLALERIEQDNELTYEQLMMIETNLFLGGFSFHDRHRDMRMDIDNMSYEELLALEEKMGNVSTALSEESLMKCIKRSTYMPASQSDVDPSNGEDDTKCSMCQEEYVTGDELGKLTCNHFYHANCINQWLRQKNWCPICKTSAIPPASNAEENKD